MPPVGLHLRKSHAVADLPKGAIIRVPNDSSVEERELNLLQSVGLLTLREGAGILATLADVVDNPKGLKIKELDAGVVGRSIDDLAAAVVNT